MHFDFRIRNQDGHEAEVQRISIPGASYVTLTKRLTYNNRKGRSANKRLLHLTKLFKILAIAAHDTYGLGDGVRMNRANVSIDDGPPSAVSISWKA